MTDVRDILMDVKDIHMYMKDVRNVCDCCRGYLWQVYREIQGNVDILNGNFQL